MHRFILFLVVFSAVSLLAGCPDDAGLTELEVDMTVSPTVLDFGPVYAGQTRVLPVSVENTGAAPLVFSNLTVSAQSGPAMISVDTTRPRLRAGESMAVEVRVTGDAMSSGIFTASVDIAADRGPSVEVNLSAEIRELPPCDDDNPCTVDSFDGESCVNEPAINGSPCDDNNACTLATVCVESQCVGQAIECADTVDCTVDFCDPAVGCVFEPMNTACEDDDGCTIDTCNSVVGCVNEPAPVGSVCHLDECNEIGFCIAGSCALQPVPDGVPCEDGDFCTENDTCQSQICTPGVQRETGAADPIVVVGNAITADLCLHQEAETDCSLGFTAFAEVRPDEVLATHTGNDGRSLVLWRSHFARDGGGRCSPFEDAQLGAVFASPPQTPNAPQEGRRAPAEEPVEEPPFSNICAAGVFYTQTDPLSGASATVQLSSTAGSAAAAFAIDGSDLLAVGIVDEATGNIHVRSMPVTESAFSEAPMVFSALPDRRAAGQAAPLSGLAIDIASHGVAVAAVPFWRDLYSSAEACGDLCTCADIDGLTFCNGGAPAVYVASEALLGGVTFAETRLALLPDAADLPGECPEQLQEPFFHDGLSVRIDDDGVAGFGVRAKLPTCIPLANSENSGPRPRLYVGTSDVGGALAAIPDDNEGPYAQQVDTRFLPWLAGINWVANADCVDPTEPACWTTFSVFNATVDSGGVTETDTLLTDIPASAPTSAHGIGLDDGAFTLVRTGQSFQVVRRDEDTGLIERVAAPPLDNLDQVMSPPVTGPGQAAFITASLDPECAENVPVVDAGPDAGNAGDPIGCVPESKVMVQRFGCYYGQDATGCLAHTECDDGAVCTSGGGVCLPPAGCDGGDCDTCAGECSAVAQDCAVIDVCPGYGDLLAPVCPGTARPHFGGDDTCSWQCVDENCAPLLFNVPDGGVADGGVADGGAFDAGLGDAGDAPDGGAAGDAGLLDAGDAG